MKNTKIMNMIVLGAFIGRTRVVRIESILAALRKVLGESVRQMGSLVAPDRLRFDYAAARPTTGTELREIERLVNEEILRDRAVTKEVLPMDAAKARGARTKSGLMIGLGESEADILRAFADLRQAGCDLLTVGQYLRPTAAHPPVAKYYTPEEFEAFAAEARRAGFLEVVSGPLVRSSYGAGRLYDAVHEKDGVPCAT